jgi:hypothetical protein
MPLIGVLLAALDTAAEPEAAASSAAATVRNIGSGNQPGLAVDNAGTAYVVWNGPENTSTLRFCRIPRGGTACTPGLTSTIATLGTTATRPFVFVAGSRVIVVSYRYPQSGTDDFSGTYLYTSSDGGQTFGPGVNAGQVPFYEMIEGPGDTLSGVTHALPNGMVYQNLPAASVGETSQFAVLSPTDYPYTGTIAMFDATTPFAVFSAGDASSQYRFAGGSGSPNDVATWTTARALGYAAYPKLAAGPLGVWMVAGGSAGNMVARMYDVFKEGGSGFTTPLSLGQGDPARQHLFQDVAGRLHSVVQYGDGNGVHLRYWISDGAGAWRSATIASQDPGVAGAFNSPRVATAADHIGWAVWEASSSGVIRIVPVGPDVPKPRPGLSLSGNAKHVGNKVEVTASGKVVLPDGVAPASGCEGSVTVTIKKGTRVLATKTDAVNNQCRFSIEKSIRQGEVGGADKLKLVARFSGNPALASKSTSRTVRVRG